MKKTFQLAQILQNLNKIKRIGGNLTLGIPAELNISIAEHSYAVAYLAVLFHDSFSLEKTKKMDSERLLRFCLIHDWRDAIVSDLPAGSPSYASFWDIDIRKEYSSAGKNATKAILDLIKSEIQIEKYQEIKLNEQEQKIFEAADISAYLFEMLEWIYLGLKHEGWEMIWFNTVDRLRKIELPFTKELATEFNKAYRKGSKVSSVFLAQPKKQSNPKHKLY